MASDAILHHEAGDFAKAETLYLSQIRKRPADASLHYNFGLLLAQTGRREEAITRWRIAAALRPDEPRTLNNLANLLAETGQTESALQVIDAALALDRGLAETHSNRGLILWQAGHWGEAETSLRRAIELRPGLADAWNGLGLVLADSDRLDEAIAAYDAALSRRPDFARAGFNRSLALLAAGRLKEGWQAFEWRRHGGARTIRPNPLAAPEWQGEDLAGRTILLHAEQGYGDTLQFARYVALVAARGGRVVLEVPQALVRLLAPLGEVVAEGHPLPPFDCHLPLMSAPRVMKIDIPSKTPYLAPPPGKIDLPPGRKIGLVWAGDPRPHDPYAHALDRRRSLNLAVLRPLLELPDRRFVSLQMGAAARQIEALPEPLRPFDAMRSVVDFADTARIMAELDLVITVDTAAAHLAGALGRPVWILSRFDSCWRWLRGREDSPWYPTARLFRQARPGDWEEVIARVAKALAQW